jgi:predicted RND superfamily exporter protein
MSRSSRRGRLPRLLVDVAIRHPLPTLGVWAAVLGLAGVGVARLEIDTTTESVLDRSSPEWSYYQHSQELFGGDEIVVVSLAGEEPFDPGVLSEIGRLTDAYERLPGVRRVDSLRSVPMIRVTPDGSLNLDAALADGVPRTPEGRLRLAEQVRADRIAPRSLVSEDGRVFAVNVILERDFDGDYDAVVAAIRGELRDASAHVSGVPVFRSEANARTRSEILLFVPLTMLAIAALLVAVYRSLLAVALALAVGAIGTWVMAGAMGLLGASISLITMILPSSILALGCSYVMHVLSAGSGAGDREALRRQLLPIALPVALSGLTTALGFAVIGAVRIEEVRNVGAFGAIGVLGLVGAALSVAPALLALWPPSGAPPRLSGWTQGPLRDRLLRIALGHASWVFAVWIALLVLFSFGVERLRIETDATRWFPPGSEVRDAYETIRAQLSGISPINVVLESGSDVRVTDPEVVRALDGLARDLESLPDVGKAVSLADPLRQIHGGFRGDPSQPLPEDRALIAQYMLLLDSVDEIRDLVTPDRAAANVVLRADNNGSGPLLAIGEEALRWWRENGVAGVRPRATGIMYEFARAEDEIALGQLRGLGLAVVVIIAVLFAALRSARLVIVALIPNLVPIVMVFGLMGLLGVPLDAGTVIVGCLALGIAVDDTVHLISSFQDGYQRGEDPREALRGALSRVIHPLVLTTVAVGLGFGLLGLSRFTFTRNLGLLIAGVMGVCLLADLILLPALLGRLPRARPAGSSPASK